MDTLEQARAEIDAVDAQLAALFERLSLIHISSCICSRRSCRSIHACQQGKPQQPAAAAAKAPLLVLPVVLSSMT